MRVLVGSCLGKSPYSLIAGVPAKVVRTGVVWRAASRKRGVEVSE